MILDTQQAESLSVSFASLQRICILPDAHLQTRHNELQSHLQRASDFFARLSYQGQAAERALMGTAGSQQAAAASQWKTTSYVTGSLGGLLKGRRLFASASTSYTVGEAVKAGRTEHLYGEARGQLVPVAVTGTAEAVLKNLQGKWDPKVNLSGSAGAALAHGSLSGGAAGKNSYVGGSASGQAMVAYGKAELAFEPEDLRVDLEGGAALLRGECSVAFKAFGYVVTLTAEGSLGSAEAGFSWQFSSREWEFGAKLGFIAGAGIRIRVVKE